MEIDQDGNETLLENYSGVGNYPSKIAEGESIEVEETNPAETDGISGASGSDVIWITADEAADLKSILDNYFMLLAAEILVMNRPELEKDVKSRREQIRQPPGLNQLDPI